MKKLSNILFSMATSVLLMLIFAVGIAWATFIENDFGTETAKKLVYVSPWFETLLWLIAINMIGSIFKHKMYVRKKWTILLFHVAFLFILAGGAVTRYFGYEGTMHIREGKSSNSITLTHNYLIVSATKSGMSNETTQKIRLTERGSNQFKAEVTVAGEKVKVETIEYIPNASEVLAPVENGVPAISLFIMDEFRKGYENDLLFGEDAKIGNKTYSFNESITGDIKFSYENGVVKVISTEGLQESNMMSKDTVFVDPNVAHVIKEKVIYRTAGHVFVVKSFLPSAAKVMQNSTETQQTTKGLLVNVAVGNESKQIQLINKEGAGIPQKITVRDVEVELLFGLLNKQLPFSLELKDFILERYPGSMSPSSYASEVVLHDASKNVEMPYRIYMNNILKYRGYRFFQSSFDQDEQGTILSVSHDFAGTFITYFGYLLMTIGMVVTLFNKKSRFLYLLKKSKELAKLKKGIASILVLLFVLSSSTLFAQTDTGSAKAHFQEFETLLVQDQSGRLEPISSLASEVMRKVYRKEKYHGLKAVEVLHGMISNPSKWQSEPIIKISNGQLAKELGAPSGYISFQNMFGENGYKIQQLVNETYHKSLNSRNKYDKEVINLDERINVCYQVFNGSFIRVLPIPRDANNKWASIGDFPKNDNVDAPVNLYSAYLSASLQAQNTGNWNDANLKLKRLKAFQEQYGKQIFPSEIKTKMEVSYGKLNIFGNLAHTYQLIGLILLIINLLLIFKPSWTSGKFKLVGVSVSIVLFLIYTGGMGVRWYISGHAPWSNGYEAMVFVGWATALAGLIFSRRSFITLAVTNLLSGFVLMVAGLSWMNPEITPLVPVLKSYWLIVHVAVITSSYGFLAIGALLGFVNLNLIIFQTKENRKIVKLHIQDISIVIEVTLIIGLLLLTVGSFLGGVWANESWGRYWGWDPKETWALITILVYSIIVHLKRIPSFKGEAIFSGLSLIGFSSVLMTFFGVNYYLSGLHSYAQGDTPPIPNGIFYAASIIIIVFAAAYYREGSILSKKK